MKRYTFDTFKVDDANRAALEECRSIAALKPVGSLPLLLTGDHGAGKSHLLYSIINHMKEEGLKAAKAFIRAGQIPKEVIAVIDRPEKVQRFPNAVLLVDQLDRFTDQLEELEALVQLFLECDHYVVLASRKPIGQLDNLPDGLRTLLRAGQTITLIPPEAPPESEGGSSALRSRLKQQRGEIRSLKAALQQARQAAFPPMPAAPESDVEAELRTTRAELDELHEQLKLANAYRDSMQRELDNAPAREPGVDVPAKPDEDPELQAELEAAREEAKQLAERAHALLGEVEKSRAQFIEQQREQEARIARLQTALQSSGAALVPNALAQARTETAEVAQQLEALRTEFDAKRAQFENALAEAKAHMQSAESEQLADLEQSRGRMQEMEQALEEAQAECRRVREELAAAQAEWGDERTALDEAKTERDELQAQQLLEGGRVESLNEALVTAREELAKTQSDLDKTQAERDNLIADMSAARESWNEERVALEMARSARDDLEATMETASLEMDEAHGSLEKVRVELAEARKALQEADAERGELQSQLDEAKDEMAAQAADMDALRSDAAGQVAEANAQAGELEGLLVQLRGQYHEAHEAGKYVGGELRTLRDQLASAVEAVDGLTERLDEAMPPPPDIPNRGNTEPVPPEGFEDDPAAEHSEALNPLPENPSPEI
jgi:hypothetical protein